MLDIKTMLNGLERPRLLIRAARLGAQEYNRSRHLMRVLNTDSAPRPAEAVVKLLELEDGADRQRRENDAAYSLVRHVDLLIALLGEANLLEEGTQVHRTNIRRLH